MNWKALEKKCLCICIDVFFIFISSWFYITILCRVRFIRLPFFYFIFFFTNGWIDCSLPFSSNFSRVSEIQLRSRSCILFFFNFFFFSNSFPKDNIHSIKKKRRTGDNYVASKDCVSIDFMWFNFIFRVHIFHVHIDIATKVWVINLWKCHSVNIKSKSGFSLLVAIVGFQRVHGY